MSSVERTLRQVGLLRVAAGLVALVLLLAGCSGDSEPPPASTAAHGTEFAPATHPHIAVKHGEKFSIVVDQNGAKWKLSVAPDASIVRTEPEDSAGGKLYFVFTASKVGESALEVYDDQHATGYSVHISVI